MTITIHASYELTYMYSLIMLQKVNYVVLLKYSNKYLRAVQRMHSCISLGYTHAHNSCLLLLFILGDVGLVACFVQHTPTSLAVLQ